jgi:methionyl-tRNA formyltransferase
VRFAFCGIDFLIEPFIAFIKAGWTPVKLFTRPCDGVVDFNERAIAIARELKIPIQMSRLLPDRDLKDLQLDALIVSGYPWLIRGWESYARYGVNFHPSPLPQGRGPYPLYNAILEGLENWGVTAHKLEPDFDTGAILDAEQFPMSPTETHEILLSKCQMGMRELAQRLAGNIDSAWQMAQPQGEGSYWQRISDESRSLDWNRDVAWNLRIQRTFGFVETLAMLGSSRIYVREAHGWEASHNHAPGTIVHHYRRNYIIAVPDGYIQIIKWSPVSLGEIKNFGR